MMRRSGFRRRRHAFGEVGAAHTAATDCFRD